MRWRIFAKMTTKELLVRKNLEWLITQHKTNPHKLEELTGVPQPTIHRILIGESADPRTKTLQPLADYFGVTVAELRDRDLAPGGGVALPPGSYMRVVPLQEEDERLVRIPKVKLRLSAGIMGFSTEPEHFDGSTLSVHTEWIERNGYIPSKLIAIRVKGESMEPTLYEDDLVIVNTADTKMVDGNVYAVNYEGEPVVKRLQREAGQWYLASDNPAPKFGKRLCQGGECIMIGRIVKREGERL